MTSKEDEVAVYRLYVRRIADGPTQRVPLPPPLIGPDGAQVGDLVLVQQSEGNNRARHGVIAERPNLRTNLCTVRYA